MKSIVSFLLLSLSSHLMAHRIECQNSNLKILADTDQRQLSLSGEINEDNLLISDYQVDENGAGALLLEEGILVLAIDSAGQLEAELAIGEKTYYALSCQLVTEEEETPLP